jgi:CRP/FNR family transcriptional regulator
MAMVCQCDVIERPRGSCGNICSALEADVVQKSVKTGEILFQAGDARALYRVERGAVCHYMLWADGRHDVIEFAFPGDIVGLGHLSEHVSTAQAMVDTVVSLVSDAEFAENYQNDDPLSFRLSAAIEREFDFVRDQALVARTPLKSAVRVANFLLALSRVNSFEGRERELIADDITAGFVAEKLDMSIECLGEALLRLKKEGAVRETSRGLRIVDTATLQRLADAA